MVHLYPWFTSTWQTVPVITKLSWCQKSNPWFTSTLQAFRTSVCHAENLRKCTHSALNWSSLSLCATSTTTSFSHPKKPFYCNLISSSSHSPKHLANGKQTLIPKSFSTLTFQKAVGERETWSRLQLSLSLTALLPSSQTKYPTSVCLSLATPPHHLPPHSPSSPTTPPTTISFTPASESEILNILSNCPNKQSDYDPIPTWLLKECASVLVPTITNIVNFSLTSGQFHPILKESVISPLLKKSTLDKHELSISPNL